MKLPNIFVPEKDLGENIKRLLKEEKPDTNLKYAKFEVINVYNYAKGIAKLKEQGRKPFTFYENIKARIIDYEINGENAEFFQTHLYSITGIAYKAYRDKFKLIMKSDKLENIHSEFNQKFVPINYNTEGGIEFDRTKGKYVESLTREEAKNHEFWLAAMNGDKEKLAKFIDIWFDKTGEEKGMGVYIWSYPLQDELHTLVLNINDKGSGIFSQHLCNNVQFISNS